jgi:hypothetical protein
MAECPICGEEFNRRTRLKVSCGHCNNEACRVCVQTYLVNTVDDPHCMHCKHAWDREFIDQECTKVFRNGDLKRHREQVRGTVSHGETFALWSQCIHADPLRARKVPPPRRAGGGGSQEGGARDDPVLHGKTFVTPSVSLRRSPDVTSNSRK